MKQYQKIYTENVNAVGLTQYPGALIINKRFANIPAGAPIFMFNWAEDNIIRERVFVRGRQAGQLRAASRSTLPGKPGRQGPDQLSLPSRARSSGRARARPDIAQACRPFDRPELSTATREANSPMLRFLLVRIASAIPVLLHPEHRDLRHHPGAAGRLWRLHPLAC